MEWFSSSDDWLSRWLFERALAVTYLLAFAAVANRFRPLLGERGLMPAPRFLAAVPFRRSPSLFHWRYSDRLVVTVGWTGAGVAGLLLKDSIETTFRSLWIVAIVLIVFGVVLGVLDVVGKKVRRIEHMTFGGGLLIGLAQMLALVPGVSRSGATVSMGLALGYTRPAAARFAFLLAVPAVFLSGLYEAATSLGETGAPFGIADTLVATVVAFVVGFVVIAAFMNYISKRSFMPFVVYRIALGIVLIVLLSLGVIQP